MYKKQKVLIERNEKQIGRHKQIYKSNKMCLQDSHLIWTTSSSVEFRSS